MSLQYKISSWLQLRECLSNTDRALHASCRRIISKTLQGLVVQVEHDQYGTLFSYLVNGDGSSLSDLQVAPMSTNEILEQLKRFGFYIIYEQEKHLPGKMLEYLLTLDGLGYDKIRILFVDTPPVCVGETNIVKYYVVAFKVAAHPEWINNTYRAKEEEISQGTLDGTVLNVSAVSKDQHFDWNFLGDYVLNIKDILAENASVEIS